MILGKIATLNLIYIFERRNPWPYTHPCGLRSSESSMLCWKLGDPRSGVALLEDVVDAVLIVVVHRLAVPLGQAFGGLVTRKLSASDRFFTWCITPGRREKERVWSLNSPAAEQCYSLPLKRESLGSSRRLRMNENVNSGSDAVHLQTRLQAAGHGCLTDFCLRNLESRLEGMRVLDYTLPSLLK